MKKLFPLLVVLMLLLFSVFAAAEGMLTLKTTEEKVGDMVRDHSFYTSLGNYFIKNGKADKALPVYEMALKLSPDNEKVLNNIGVYYYQQGMDESAIEYFKRAVQSDEDYEVARSNLAVMHHYNKDYDKAVKQLRILIEMDPDNPSYNYDMGINIASNFRYNEEGDLDEAIKYFEKADELSPGYSNSEHNIKVLREIQELL